MDQRSQHKTTYTDLIKYTVEISLKIIGIGKNNLKRWLIRNALISTINKWDLITLKVCVWQRTLSNTERGSLDRERGKSFTNSNCDIGIMPKVK